MPLSQIETASLSTALNAPTATALSTASGSAPSYSARAWVNFNGTGTVAIRGSANVSSITDNGTGAYTVNLTTAMPDANYSVSGAAGSSGTASGCWFTTGFNTNAFNTNNTTSSFKIQIYFATTSVTDVEFIYAAVFR